MEFDFCASDRIQDKVQSKKNPKNKQKMAHIDLHCVIESSESGRHI